MKWVNECYLKKYEMNKRMLPEKYEMNEWMLPEKYEMNKWMLPEKAWNE